MVQIIRPTLVVLGLTCAAIADEPSCESMEIAYLCAHNVGRHATVKLPLFRKLKLLQFKNSNAFDLTILCTDAGRIVMSISNEYDGTLSLTYSTLVGQRGLGFALFPLGSDGRQGISGPTPGSFAVLNKCELPKRHVEGVLFHGTQILPQNFFGVVDAFLPQLGLDAPEKEPASDQDPAASPTEAREIAQVESDRWDFSGHYEFTIPDYYCLNQNDPAKSGKAKHSRRTATTKDPGKVCPKIKGHLVADAVMAETPII
jgi:hypothetical protein